MARVLSRLLPALAGVLLIAAMSACKNPDTIPTANQLSEDFSGVVAKGGTSDRKFTVQYAYAATTGTIKLTSLTSATSGAVNGSVGVAFGQLVSDGSCVRFPSATQNAAVLNTEYKAPDGFFPLAGDYCFAVFDSGTLTESVNYVVRIIHY